MVVNPGWGIQITSFIKFSFPGDDFPQLSTDPITRGMVSMDGGSWNVRKARDGENGSSLAPPHSRLHAVTGCSVCPLTWPCFSDAMLMYRGVPASLALALATASDTAPMAMLPWRTGSGGSGGMIGFSKRVSLRPGEGSMEKGFVSRNLTMTKTTFSFNAALTEDPAQTKGRETRLEFSSSVPRDFQICSLSSTQSSWAMDSAS